MTAPAPECLALAEGLRDLRTRTGLSLAALGERTVYSKSSWERYLNGKKLPPRQAVEALCALAGEPVGRLLALWELAEVEWSGRASHAAPARPSPSGRPSPSARLSPSARPTPAARPSPAADTTEVDGDVDAVHRRTWRRLLFAFGAGTATLVAATVLAALSLRGSDTGSRRTTDLAPPALDPPAGCWGKSCEGRDPAAMSCALNERLEILGAHRTKTGALVQIRYSKVCAAAWGRFWHTKIGDEIVISAPGSPPQRAPIRNADAAGEYVYTPMVDGRDTTALKVCFDPVGVGETECFQPS